MTIRKIYVVFGLLSFCFSVFAVDPIEVCTEQDCRNLKYILRMYYSSFNNNINNVLDSESTVYNAVSQAGLVGNNYISDVNGKSNFNIEIQKAFSSLSEVERQANLARGNLDYVNTYVNAIDCSSCTNGQCSIDLGVLEILTNIYASVDFGFSQIALGMTNIIDFFDIDYDSEYGDTFSERFEYATDILDSIDTYLDTINNRIYTFALQYDGRLLNFYRVYDPFVHEALSSLASNLAYSVDYSFTNRFNSSSRLGWDRFQSYLQAQNANQTVSWYPVSPYNSQQNLQNATIYDALAAGFENTLISLGSLNNYFYWLKNHMPSNSFDDAKILASIGALSNTLNRIDSYVVQDFSNEFYRLSRYLITNSVAPSSLESNYYHSVTGSLLTIRDLLNTNNLYLSSIEGAVTNIDFSVGRFRDYLLGSQNSINDYDGSEDTSYYDFLTNKYIVGTSEDGVSSNWFERIETLLAALVFSTDSKTNIVSSGSFDGISESDVRGTLEDVSFSNEFNDMVGSVGDVQRSFTQILISLHSSLKNVVKPQSISIGFTDTGTSTTGFDALSGGEFEVSVSVGEFGSFTEVVRAVTTMIIVLFTLIMIYKTCFFLIRNAYRLYSFGRTLVTSIFFR